MEKCIIRWLFKLKGTKNWKDMKALGWIQTRSAIESIIHDHNLQLTSLLNLNVNWGLGRYWLETCGTHSAINALEAIGKISHVKTPGDWLVRSPDLLTLFMNDPRNDIELKKIDPNFSSTSMGNEYAKLYPYSVFNVFGFHPEYKEFHDWKVLVDLVSSGRAVQICYVSPGHFVTAVAYDEVKDELLVVDPWPNHIINGNWWNFRLTKEDYNGNVKPYGIIY